MFNPQAADGGGGAPIHYMPVMMNTPGMGNHQALQYLSVQHPAMQGLSGVQSLVQIPTHPPPIANSTLTQAKLGPVERAVLTQALGDQRTHRRRTQLRCETCNVCFNSQGQAETHYRGKRHARITEIRRRKGQLGAASGAATAASDNSQKVNSEGGNAESSSNSEPSGQEQMSEMEKGKNILHPNPESGNPHMFKPIVKSDEIGPSLIPGMKTEHNLPLSPVSENNENNSSSATTAAVSTLDTTIEKMIEAEKMPKNAGNYSSGIGLEIREETEEEKKARLEMEAEVQKMLENLPPYVKRVVRAVKPLDESLHCKVCDVWVNSETQMKQHLGSLRHKNTIAGIPVPPRPDKVEPIKPRSSHQYKCELCNVTLNSEVQLLQHLRSQRHKATLEGKPPKPRWVPYERFREQQRVQAKLKLQAAYANAATAYQPIMMPQIAQMGQLQGHQIQGLQGIQSLQGLQGLQGIPPGMQFVQLM